MSGARLRQDFQLLRAAVEEAAVLARRYYARGAEVWEKSPGNPVTEADLAVDELLKKRLLGGRPDYGWLSEESPDDGSRLERKYVWIGDPIDGTRAFVRHHPEFAIAAGLVCDGEPVAGVVANPATEEIFAAAGGRLRVNGKLQQPPPQAKLSSARILGSRSAIERACGVMEGCEFFTVHSIAYRMALVAAGRYDAAIAMSPTSDWDIAGAHALVRAGGGCVTGSDGVELTYKRPTTRHHGVIAAKPTLHGQIIGRLTVGVASTG
ncbi:MAG: 3'(2'),5'-bisphosphate nucleotidase CysQ [Alphaproteobacteria bacterium]|nr:3'(2'),5'-bisphosphate nucleotidase CysQ [Alphaproteobacteria bacterium]